MMLREDKFFLNVARFFSPLFTKMKERNGRPTEKSPKPP
jgi:hypothetical protein